ncbi:MAG: NAD(P)/FAD-dependent oxidoreductase [Candidatus Norongarragalinales archaeon]
MVGTKKFDCVVVGASCVGGMTARAIASKGASVALLEEHARPGKFNKCTALVSASGLERIGVDFKKTVLNEIHGAIVHSPRVSFSVQTKTPVAFVLDRQAFDEKCVGEAINKGAELFLNAGARKLSQNGGLSITTPSGEFHSRVVVGADGLGSFVARESGLPPFRRFASAWEAEYSFTQETPDKVHVFLDQSIAPNFFAWSVPVNESTARVGLATTNPSALNSGKRKLLKKMGLGEEKKKGREFNYSIPLFPRSKTQKDSVILVGDAAGQVKSTTGGGIVFGGLCGQQAASAIENYFENGVLDYEQRWRKAYEKTFRMHWLLHSKLFSLPNVGLDFAFAFAKLSGVPFALERIGDMDFVFKSH